MGGRPDERQLVGIIEQIYEAAGDVGRMADLGPVIAPAFDSDSAILYGVLKSTYGIGPIPALAGVMSATSNLDSWAAKAYGDYYQTRDEWFARGCKKGIPAVVLGQELIDDRSFERTEFYSDWCRKIGAFHVLGCQFHVSGDLIGAIGFHRPRQAPQFDEDDRRTMGLLLPHLQRALQINHRLGVVENQRGLTADILDRLSVGIIIVEGDGRLLFANRIAERTLQGGDAITAPHGRLRSRDVKYGAALQKAVVDAASPTLGLAGGAGGVVALPRSSGAPLVLLISPLQMERTGFGRSSAAALVIFSEPHGTTTVGHEALAQAFKLTPAEARLLAALLSGEALPDYAAATGISINTAKRHLDHIFNKTGYRRQTDLIRAILGDPAFRLYGLHNAQGRKDQAS